MYTNSEKTGFNLIIIIILMLLVYSFFGYLLPENLSYIIFIVALVGIIFNLIINKRRHITINQIYIIFLIMTFIAIQILTIGYSLFPESSKNIVIFRSMILFIGMLMVLQLRWHEKAIKCILFFSVIHIFFTLFSYLFPEPFKGVILPLLPDEIGTESIKFMLNGMYAGITDQIGRNAFYISIGIAILYSFLISTDDKVTKQKKIIIIVLFVLSLLTLLLTGKRGHLVANIFSMLFVISLFTKIKGKSVLLKIISAIIALIISIYLLIFLFPEAAAPLLRFIERQGGDQTSGRIDLYLLALDLAKEKPIFGWGTGVFNNLYSMGTHNIYLQVLSENGFIGLVSFTAILLLNLINTFKGLKINYYLGDKVNNNVFLISLYIQIFFVLYGMTGNPLNDGFILIIYFIAASIPYSSPSQKFKQISH